LTFYSQTLIAANRPAAQDSQTTIHQTIITASHESGKVSGALAAVLPVIAVAGVATEAETATTDAAPAVTVAPAAATSPKAEMEEAAPPQTFTATAYALPGRTASGHAVRRGLIAADRSLPLGTRVRLDAGNYSGEYLVADRGSRVRGRVIDIWVPSSGEAVRFGRRPVRLTILKYGAKKAKRAGKAS
jgi:3D (Asp-Asp-Asp) domain-containing protein